MPDIQCCSKAGKLSCRNKKSRNHKLQSCTPMNATAANETKYVGGTSASLPSSPLRLQQGQKEIFSARFRQERHEIKIILPITRVERKQALTLLDESMDCTILTHTSLKRDFPKEGREARCEQTYRETFRGYRERATVSRVFQVLRIVGGPINPPVCQAGDLAMLL